MTGNIRAVSGWILVVSFAFSIHSWGQFDESKLRAIDAAIEKTIAEGKTPGGVLWLESRGKIHTKAYGHKSLVPVAEKATLDTIYDAASVTKVAATTLALMKLVEKHQVLVDAPVASYLPEFSAVAGDAISVRHLMTHTSGLRPGLSLSENWSGMDAAYRLACSQTLQSQPGEKFVYSDINFILLGILVAKVSGSPLDEYVGQNIFQPLGMTDSGFNPDPSLISRIAPTQQIGDNMLRGVVHDPTARRMGGVAGHAGLFTTASDLAKLARMILHNGSIHNQSHFKKSTLDQMRQVHSRGHLDSFRSLGWDVDTGYTRLRGRHFSVGGIGHTGFTGPSMWIDFETQSIVIFMSNRVHPDGKGSVLDLREEIGTLFAEAIWSPAHPPTLKAEGAVMTGLDVLVSEKFKPLHGQRIGLITNHTGHDRKRVSTIQHFRDAEDVKLVALFSPEHGIAGVLDEKVGDSQHDQLAIPIFSLYGNTRKPLPDQLADLDALVFDIQDIGCRFYTYISTMGLAMEAAAVAGIPFFVLDRPNPINGLTVDGPQLEGPPDFVGFHDIPIRHGMTTGELARMFQAEIPTLKMLQLEVIPCRGWSRSMFWSETGLPWTNPSPNMRSSQQALLYPGTGLIEMADISVGRGTDTPFEILGAPYIHDIELARELNRLALPGITFEPITFTPDSSKFAGKLCKGVRMTVTKQKRVPVLKLGIALASTLHRLYPTDFDLSKVNRLMKSEKLVAAIREGRDIPALARMWKSSIEDFKSRRAAYLMY